MVLDLGVDVLAEVVHALARAGLLGDALEHVVDEPAEQVLVLGREAEHPADDVDGDVLGVLHRGVDDGLAGGDVDAISSSSCWHSRRISGSHGSICLGANAGSRSRRAMLWNGGSLVIGGAPPIGAGIARSPGRPTDTTTARLVKFSVS